MIEQFLSTQKSKIRNSIKNRVVKLWDSFIHLVHYVVGVVAYAMDNVGYALCVFSGIIK